MGDFTSRIVNNERQMIYKFIHERLEFPDILNYSVIYYRLL